MAVKDDRKDPPIPLLSTYRLITDQARITEDVEAHIYKGSGTHEDPYVVTYIPNDPGNPFNWSDSRKFIITTIVAIETFCTAFSSSAFSGVFDEITTHFGASRELVIAGISLFVLGFATGPLLFAPLSEIYGRQIVFAFSFGMMTAFDAGCIGANNIGTLLVLRFFAGASGSSTLTNGGGVIADMFPATQRGFAMAIYTLAPSMGPSCSPMVSGFLGERAGWRWVMALLTIFSGVVWIVGMLVVPETYGIVILRRRADVLKKKTGQEYVFQGDKAKGRPSLKSVLATALLRPWVLLFREPIVLLLSLYTAIIYGTLYLLFGAFPAVFQEARGWSPGIGGLAFVGVGFGLASGCAFTLWTNKWYVNATVKRGGTVPPEERLKPAFHGSLLVPLGMFWFAWTDYPSIHWIVPIMAGVPFGFGFMIVFLAITNYLVDAYTIYAASVLAANSVLRSLFGAAFPLFTADMYDNLGIHWASTIPAFLALACVPLPFLFYFYGARIRAKCVYAAKAEAVMKQLQAAAHSASNSAARSAENTDPSDGSIGDKIEIETASNDGVNVPVEPTTSTAQTGHTAQLNRTTSRAETIQEAAGYNESPFDIDRVHTSDSVTGLGHGPTRSSRSVDRKH